MSKKTNIAFVLALTSLGFVAAGTTPAMAYSCGAQFKSANKIIAEAEGLVTKDTDSRILAMIAEAKGIAQAGIISHKKANQGHTGDVGKFMHGDSVRKGKWAQSLATQAIFLMSGETR
ncbi:MAG: hypothetical protein HQ494_15260 [Rhodospirillales bacterium]|nr:hypothetical protein [Rhodospirillales bacterium]